MWSFVFSLALASAIAIMAAPEANAAAPGFCGHSYAMLMTGAAPTSIQQDGTSTQPGALTHAIGVGVITFGAAATGSNTCSSVSGELIFNEGDNQRSPTGESFGPAHCYDAASLLSTGVPCFDGANHFTLGTVTNPGPNGNGSTNLSFNAGYQWRDGNITSCSTPFSFTLQNSLASEVVVGTSVPPVPVGVASRNAVSTCTHPIAVPILTLTMQKIGQTPVPAPAGPGSAPYLGLESISCQSWGANQSDFVSGSSNPPGIAGGAGSAVGALQTFSNGDIGGSLSFNTNDNIVTTGTPPSNNDCAIQVFPGTAFGGTYAFPDGTSNTVGLIGTSGSNCSDAITPGAGYSTSAVRWGSTDTQAYLTTTGLLSAANGFVPPGTEGTCTTYHNVPAGLVLNVVAPAALTVIDPATVASAPIKFSNSSPADCGVTAALAGTTTDGTCTLSVTPSFDSLPNSPSTAVGTLTCTCTAEDEATVSATLNFTSASCLLSGTTSRTVTCTR
jgi:hypothetical protein